MRDLNIRFSLDAKALSHLQALAEEKNISLSALLRNLVYQAINKASQKETGREEPSGRK